jgi:hypothetical protein
MDIKKKGQLTPPFFPEVMAAHTGSRGSYHETCFALKLSSIRTSLNLMMFNLIKAFRQCTSCIMRFISTYFAPVRSATSTRTSLIYRIL